MRPRNEQPRQAGGQSRNSSAIWIGVEGGALAEVVVADEQRQAATVGHAVVLPDAPDVARVLAGRFERGRDLDDDDAGRRGEQLVGPRDRQIGRANSALIDSEWPVNTGTRTHVPDTASSGMSRILRLSLRSFCSSSVSNSPSSTIEPANGSTLNAIGRW